MSLENFHVNNHQEKLSKNFISENYEKLKKKFLQYKNLAIFLPLFTPSFLLAQDYKSEKELEFNSNRIEKGIDKQIIYKMNEKVQENIFAITDSLSNELSQLMQKHKLEKNKNSNGIYNSETTTFSTSEGTWEIGKFDETMTNLHSKGDVFAQYISSDGSEVIDFINIMEPAVVFEDHTKTLVTTSNIPESKHVHLNYIKDNKIIASRINEDTQHFIVIETEGNNINERELADVQITQPFETNITEVNQDFETIQNLIYHIIEKVKESK